MVGFELVIDVHDSTHKWIDKETKTTTRLLIKNPVGQETVIVFIHSEDSVDEVLKKKKEYKKLLLNTIKENMKWDI